MSDTTDPPSKRRDIRARLGRKSQVSTPPSAESEVDGQDEDASPSSSNAGEVAPPPAFIRRPEPKSVGPFTKTTATGSGPQQMRIVVDEEALSKHGAELKKRGRKMTTIAAAAAALVGLVLGYLATTVANKNADYNANVADGVAIYDAVYKASDQVAAAKALVDRAMSAAKSRPGQPPKADYTAIAELRKLELPFSAKNFYNRRFHAFDQGIVNSLFRYNSLIGDLWDAFDRLGQKTLPEPRRAEIDAAAADSSAITSTPTGCIPTSGEGGVRCSMVYVDIPEPTAQNPSPTKVRVRATRGGRAVEKEIFRGQNLGNGASNFVILTNPEQSRGVFSQQQNAFSEYRRQLAAVAKMMNQTMEAQGKLENDVSVVASLKK